MRLFVGLDLPDAIQSRLGALILTLRHAAAIRWSPPENLHITTKFIGEWPEARLGEMKEALGAVRGPAMEIGIRGLGWFPNPHRPRVFWAAVRAPDTLAALAAATDEATARMGVATEKRAYSPHLTLARVDEGRDIAGLRRSIAALDSDDFGSFLATGFHLYLSRPGAGGSVYSKLASFPLDKS